jgi:hypothetical protein
MFSSIWLHEDAFIIRVEITFKCGGTEVESNCRSVVQHDAPFFLARIVPSRYSGVGCSRNFELRQLPAVSDSEVLSGK